MTVETQQDSNSAAGGASVLTEMLERMRTRADNAYCLYISKSRRDECLGHAIKMERGKFGQAELTAHCEVAEELGRHRALHEAAKMLEASSNEFSKPPAILFDGYAVLQALDENARKRTSPENVADVLDAVVRLMRSNG